MSCLPMPFHVGTIWRWTHTIKNQKKRARIWLRRSSPGWIANFLGRATAMINMWKMSAGIEFPPPALKRVDILGLEKVPECNQRKLDFGTFLRMGLDIVAFDEESNIPQTVDQSETNFLNVLELFRIIRLDSSFFQSSNFSLTCKSWTARIRDSLVAFTGLVVGVIRLRRAIRMSWEWRTRNLCSPGWIALLQFHPDSSSKAKQQPRNLSCLLFVAELLGLKQTLVSRWSVAAAVVCICTYVSGTHAAFCQSDVICTIHPIKSGELQEGLFSCLGNWSGYFDNPEERNCTWQEKSNKATVFSCSTHSRRLRRRRWDIYRNIKQEKDDRNCFTGELW